MHEVQCRRVSKRRWLPLTSMLAQHVFKTEDLACRATPRRTIEGPPDSNSTIMTQRRKTTHLRLTPTSINLPTLKIPLHRQHHNLQSTLESQAPIFQKALHHLSPTLLFNTTPSIQSPLNRLLQNQPVCSLTFLLDIQPHFLVPPKLRILIIFPPLTSNSMLLAIFLMTICLKTYFNLHIQDSLEQFGLLHLAVYILHSGSMMEDPLHWGPKNLLMVFLHSLKTNNDRFRNPKKYTADQILFALPFSNKEVSLAKNNRSTPWHGKNLTANNSLNNAHATSWLLQHANGGSIFSNIGP